MKKVVLSVWILLLMATYNLGFAYADIASDKRSETSVSVYLKDSNGNVIPTGSLRYYENGSWQTVPINAAGYFTVVTSASKLTYEMTYEHSKQTKSDVRVNKKDVIFQTVDVSVQLKNSMGGLIDTGNVAYYTDEWHDFGATSGGIVSKELLPGEYNFRMTYEGGSVSRQEDITADTQITFNTVRAVFQLKDNNDLPLDTGTVSLAIEDSSNGPTNSWPSEWHILGNTLNGELSKELLPKFYQFRMIYQNITQVSNTFDASFSSPIIFRAGSFGVSPSLLMDESIETKIATVDSIVVSGVTSNFNPTIYVDGQYVSVEPDGSFSTVVTLTEGMNIIEILGEYLLPNGVKIEKQVISDTSPPTITISDPADSTITTQQQITLLGSVSEPVSALTINGDSIIVNQDNSFSSTVPLMEGKNDITFQAVDLAGSSSTKALTIIRDNTAPALQVRVALGDPSNPGTEILGVMSGDTLSVDESQVYITGNVYDALTEVTVAVNQLTVPTQKLDSLDTFEKQVVLNEGLNDFEIMTADQAGNITTVETSILLTSQTEFPAISISYPQNNFTTDSSSVYVSGMVTDTTTSVSLTINDQPVSTTTSGAFNHRVNLFPRNNYLIVKAVNANGDEAVESIKVFRNYTTTLPPDPVTVAPELDSTVATTMQASTEFLYKGDQKIQHGVEEGTIETRRASVVKGKVLNAAGSPLSGVLITVKDHPEFGYTLTRTDGQFDMAVNGGENLTVKYQKDSYLQVQRQVEIPWQDYATVDSVVMMQLDPNVTTIDFSDSVEVAQGSMMSDADGSRQATLMFKQGTVAKMMLPDGSTQSLSSLSVRSTEFTVGENGPAAMPGELPPTSGYTYAAEFSVDEAIAAGATSVVFDKTVAVYVENFIGFPVGSAVPTGYYDRQKGQWIASQNGRVIQVISPTNGLADLDVDGDGVADPDSSLLALGIDSAERKKIAGLYTPGESLWRTEITHFTPWDHNWPYGPPEDAEPPRVKQRKKDLQENDDSCKKSGSIISVENQTLGEVMDISGAPCGLYYNSAMAIGFEARDILPVVLSGSSLPASVTNIVLEINVAGRFFTKSFAPQPNLTYEFNWDGKDAYDRFVQGEVIAKVKVGYVYNNVRYNEPAEVDQSFARIGSQPYTASRLSNTVTLWQDWKTTIGKRRVLRTELGGWTLGVHHLYDVADRKLYMGNGTIRRADNLRHTVRSVLTEDELEALFDRSIIYMEDIAVGSDGSVYVSGDNTNFSKIVRLKANGERGTVFEIPYCYSGDDKNECARIQKIAVTDDGTIYFTDRAYSRIHKVNKYGERELIVGSAGVGYSGDGGPAKDAELYVPLDIEVAADGSVYFVDQWGLVVRKIGTDGIITTVAGTGEEGFIDDEPRPATEAKFREIKGIDIGPDGSLYIADEDQGRIRRVSPDGIISTVAGSETFSRGDYGEVFFDDRGDGSPATSAILLNPSDVAVGQDGSLYIAEEYAHHIRKVTPEGIIYRLAGLFGENPYIYASFSSWNSGGFNFNNGPAPATRLTHPTDIAVGPNGDVYFSEDSFLEHVRMIESNFDYFDGDKNIVASKDGSQIYVFDAFGKHLRTEDALTGNTIFEFGYNQAGLISTITDIDGLVTTVERDSSGTAAAIIAPFGQRTALAMGEDSYLTSITNPEGEAHSFTYTDGGLLTGVTDPRDKLSSYAYDSLGYFVRSDYPNGGVTQLSKTENEDGFVVTTTTAEGRTETYEVDEQVDGTRSYITTDVNGLKTITIHGSDGTVTVTAPDGTTTLTKQKPDPRFGMQAPITDTLKVSTPSGLTSEFSQTRTVTQMTGDEVTGLTDELITNGKVTVSEYDGNQRLSTTTSPEGRQAFTRTDSLGRVVQSSVPGITPVNYSYDANGFLTQTEQGGRATTYSYNDQGYLQSVTDPLGRVETTAYDSVGRVTTQTLPNGEQILYSYDENGNLVSITPPGQPAHTFAYTEVDLTDGYTPPAIPDSAGGISYLYDKDKKLLQTVFSDSTSIQMVYDTTFSGSSRPMKINYDQGSTAFSYDSTTGNLTSIVSSDSVVTNYSYDGSLTTQIATSGPVSGTIDFTYNNDFQVTSQSIHGANTVGFTYDDDGLLVGAGELSLSYDPLNGLISGSQVENITGIYGYNVMGELIGTSFIYNSSTLYDRTYGLDSLGRITSINETIEGESNQYEYEYNSIGYLVQVRKNGVITADYEYDENGNRVKYTSLTDTLTAIYDEQDRMLTYGNASFVYDKRGDLQEKIMGTDTTRYDYDNLGNLRSAILPDGTLIEYIIDGENRRVAKKVNNQITKKWLYSDGRLPIAELDSANNVKVRYGPGYIIKNDTTYRVLTDHLGSVKLIVNAETGEIVQNIEYDEFGNITSTLSNDKFLDFTFAGGMYDPDTKLVRFGARDYDPSTGRWTIKDPIGFDSGDTNSYMYSFNNPINHIDLYGYSWSSFFEGFGEGLLYGAGTALVLATLPISGTALAVIGGAGLALTAYNVYDMATDPCTTGDDWARFGGNVLGGTIGGGLVAASGPKGPLFGRGGPKASKFGYPDKPGIFNRGENRIGWSWKKETQRNHFSIHGGKPHTPSSYHHDFPIGIKHNYNWW